MPKLLLEYNDKPCILNSELEKIDKTTFIVVYKIDDNKYIREDFNTLDEAIDFKTEGNPKLIFLYLESFEEETTFVEYFYIQIGAGKIRVKNNLDVSLYNEKFIIEFNLDHFLIKKLKNSNQPDVEISYFKYSLLRRAPKSVDGKTEYMYNEAFYELMPRYEDLFLESIFTYDILKNNPSISDESTLEAYLLQAKLRVEKNLEPHKNNIKQEADKFSNSKEFITLDSLIGLGKVKLEIQELKALASLRKKRLDMGLPVTPNTLHLVFTGNPGTGKTTVARLLGKIYHDIGLLKSDKVVEATRKDLIGEYVGQTAPKTQKVFEDALGGILFIDEAYSLLKSGNDFGSEAIETLLKLMEDHREEIVVIIAGYPKEIDELINSNPGLRSRFSKHIHFDDYSKVELFQIFIKLVSEYRNKLSDGAKYKIEHLIEEYYDSGYFNSNARSIRNIFEDATKRQSLRLSKIDYPTQDEMTTFIDKDLSNILN